MESVKQTANPKKNVAKAKPKIELTSKCFDKSPQDFLFVNHVNYLNKVIFILINFLNFVD